MTGRKGERGRPLTADERRAIERALPFIEEHARQIARGFPSADPEDVVEASKLRVSEITPDFDPSVQGDFHGFIYFAVRGAALNEGMRTARTSARQKAIYEMDLRFGPGFDSSRETTTKMLLGSERPPSAKAALRRAIQQHAAALVWGTLAERRTESETDPLERRQEYARAIVCLRRVQASLDKRARTILDALYKKGLTNEETGRLLDPPLSGKQVQRIHKQARAALSAELEKEGITQSPEIADGGGMGELSPG